MSALLLAVLLAQAPLDQGTLVIRQDTAELAREAFRLDAVRGAPGQAAWVLEATARYTEGRPAVVLSPTLAVAADSQPQSVEFAVVDPRNPLRILGQAAPDRFTIRLLGAHTEGAREYQMAGPTVVLDDSVFSPYIFLAWRARLGRAVPVTALVLRSKRQEHLTVEDLGLAATTLNRDPATLRHLVVEGGAAGPVDVWLDPAGRLMKVEVASRRLRVERLPPA